MWPISVHCDNIRKRLISARLYLAVLRFFYPLQQPHRSSFLTTKPRSDIHLQHAGTLILKFGDLAGLYESVLSTLPVEMC